jgi:hypothetical protein
MFDSFVIWTGVEKVRPASCDEVASMLPCDAHIT